MSHQRGRIVAATIVAPRAGELIGYVASMMRRRRDARRAVSRDFPVSNTGRSAAKSRRRVPAHTAHATGSANGSSGISRSRRSAFMYSPIRCSRSCSRAPLCASPGCSPDAMAAAIARGAGSGIRSRRCGGAAGTESVAGCEAAQVANAGMCAVSLTAQEAFRQGGSSESLAPVRQAIASLGSDCEGAARARRPSRGWCCRPPLPRRRASAMR